MTSTPPGPGETGSDSTDDRFDPYRYGRPDPDRQQSWPTRADTDQPRPMPSRPPTPYAPPGYPGHTPPPAPEQSGTAGIAIAALVVGIAAVVLCFLNFLDILIAIAGLIVSIVAITATKKGRRGRTLAVTGLVLSIVGGIAATVIGFYFYGRIKDCVDQYPAGSSQYQNCARSKL